MCGLFGGLSTHLNKNEVGMISELCYLSALRGSDSTGVSIGYRKKKEPGKYGVYTRKMVEPAHIFLQDRQTIATLDTSSFFVMGHTRAKTIGAPTLENAHPHEVDHITGTHNGTISHWGNNDKSDSRILFERIARDGVAKAFGDADPGAYATVFADRRARTLNFFRNEKRPLFLAWNKPGNLLLWASEKEMIDLVAARNNEKMDEVWLLKTNTLFQVPFATVATKVDEIKLIKPEPVPFVSVPRIFPRTSFPGSMRGVGSAWDPAMKEEKKDKNGLPMLPSGKGLAERIAPTCERLHSPALLHTFPKGVHWDKEYYQCIPLKGVIPREDAEVWLQVGCAGCGVEGKIWDTDLKWFNLEEHLCKSCQKCDFCNTYINGGGASEVICG